MYQKGVSCFDPLQIPTPALPVLIRLRPPYPRKNRYSDTRIPAVAPQMK